MLLDVRTGIFTFFSYSWSHLSPSHTAYPLDLGLLTTNLLSHLPFTDHWETDRAVWAQVTSKKFLFWAKHTWGGFFFSHQSHEAFGGPGSWASSAFVGRPPCSLIASAFLTRSLHVLSALYALHIYENLSLPPTELTV